jgi:hypothetical protein
MPKYIIVLAIEAHMFILFVRWFLKSAGFEVLSNSDPEEYRLLQYDLVSVIELSDISEEYTASIFSVKELSQTSSVLAGWLLNLFFYPEDGSSIFLHNSLNFCWTRQIMSWKIVLFLNFVLHLPWLKIISDE